MKALQPYLKALTPLVLAIVGSVVHTIAVGGFTGLSWQVLVAGACTAVATYLVPNKPAVQPPK